MVQSTQSPIFTYDRLLVSSCDKTTSVLSNFSSLCLQGCKNSFFLPPSVLFSLLIDLFPFHPLSLRRHFVYQALILSGKFNEADGHPQSLFVPFFSLFVIRRLFHKARLVPKFSFLCGPTTAVSLVQKYFDLS